jgi:allantoin racemase
MNIRVVAPVAHARFNQETAEEFGRWASTGTEVSVVNLDEGPQSIESECEDALVVPDFLRKAKEAESAGCDAVICDCFGDPGVRAARELVEIPVIGPGEAAMLLAASLGHKFSVVTVLCQVFPLINAVAWRSGVDRKLASIRSVDIPVLELHDKARMIAALHKEMERAIHEDHAEVLVLGCTGMMGVAKQLQQTLKDGGLDVPVVDPVAAAMKLAETTVSLGVRQSRLAYHKPKAYLAARTAA